MCTVRIAKRDVNARVLLILQDLPDYVFQFDVGADGKLTHAIAVFIGVTVAPESLLQLAIFRTCLGETIAFYRDRQRMFPQIAERRAQPVADDSVDNECSIYFARRGEHFSARKVAPFVRADNAAGLDPSLGSIQFCC